MAAQAAAGPPAAAGPLAAPRPLDRGSPMPLWAQLRAELRRRLEAGAFDADFPGEMALVAAYGVSRHTVRSALRELRADGVVLAERGRRPRVAPPSPITQPLGALYSLFASVESAGLRQTSVIRARDIRADAVIADHLGLEASTPLFRLERLRLAGEEPLALDTVWLPADLGAPLLDADFTHTALYDELAERTGTRLDGGREYIRAVVPARAQQRLLGIGPATGALAISRLGYAAGRPVEWRHTLIRGDRFSLLAEFSARTGYRLAPAQRSGSALPASTASASAPSATVVTATVTSSSRD
ncbi:MAG TPA: GntR family transcriptional regulator [Streptosporangiaceae bacterium]|nr:GntR family transcriptional regulator [Streptosporangiaceae bacterium]